MALRHESVQARVQLSRIEQEIQWEKDNLRREKREIFQGGDWDEDRDQGQMNSAWQRVLTSHQERVNQLLEQKDESAPCFRGSGSELMPNPENPYNRTELAPGRWIVLCRADRQEDGWPGNYTLATSSGFSTREDAEHFPSKMEVEISR